MDAGAKGAGSSTGSSLVGAKTSSAEVPPLCHRLGLGGWDFRGVPLSPWAPCRSKHCSKCPGVVLFWFSLTASAGLVRTEPWPPIAGTASGIKVDDKPKSPAWLEASRRPLALWGDQGKALCWQCPQGQTPPPYSTRLPLALKPSEFPPLGC